MPDIDTMKTSKYLTKLDVGTGTLVTINRMVKQTVPPDINDDGYIWLLYVNEFEKAVWTNVTHRETIAAYLGSRNSDDWTGKQIVLWNDPSIFHAGKVGAIRVKPANQTQPQTQTQTNQYDQTVNNNPTGFVDSDIPGFD